MSIICSFFFTLLAWQLCIHLGFGKHLPKDYVNVEKLTFPRLLNSPVAINIYTKAQSVKRLTN